MSEEKVKLTVEDIKYMCDAYSKPQPNSFRARKEEKLRKQNQEFLKRKFGK